MHYEGRPGLSPVLAALIASGRVQKTHVILDVGCGTGSECLMLARWGFRHVYGLDSDAGEVRIARGRAARSKLHARPQFFVGAPEDLPPSHKRAAFDVALHTLVANNLEDGFARHFRAIAEALRPDGLLVLTERMFWRDANAPVDEVRPLQGISRYFDLSPSVTTHLAELSVYDERKQRWTNPGHAPVAVWLGTPKRQPRKSRR